MRDDFGSVLDERKIPYMLLWRVAGPRHTKIAALAVYQVNGRAVIVQEMRDGGWEAFAPVGDFLDIDETIAAVTRNTPIPPAVAPVRLKLNEKQNLYVRSMGKALRVTAIFSEDDDANRHMAKSDDAVVACFGRLTFMARKYDKGAKIDG